MYTFLLMLVLPGLLVLHTAQVKAVKPDQDEDVLEEVMADGFLINTEATTLSVKNQSQDNYKAASTPNTGPLQQRSSLTSQEDTSDKTEDAIVESSGMFPSIPDVKKKASRHFPLHATAHNPGRILSTSALPFPEEEAGSAVEPERTIPIDLIVPVTRKDGGRMLAIAPETREPAQVRNSVNPTTASLAEDGTPGWLIIVSFCLTVGAILCVLVGIATKDKWYKPRSRSLDITSGGNTEEYGKTVTLPLVEKEQEMVTLMSAEKAPKNDGELTVISLEEPPEKEYLM